MIQSLTLDKSVEGIMKEQSFSGVVQVNMGKEVLVQKAAGYYNRQENIPVNPYTRFGIASGCKLFTAIAICQLVEQGLLHFNSKLSEVVEINFPNFSEDVTVHHLLTHTSGVPDYFDEAVMEDYEELWKLKPMYGIRTLQDFLPMFQEKKQMFKPGEQFHYNNAAYVVLGLIVEERTGKEFSDYIQENVFNPCNMEDSGYFSMDALPHNTAIGYIDEADGTYRSNIYSIPVKGGADGGAYVTAPDMIKFWDGLMSYRLLSKEMTHTLLTAHVKSRDNVYYGYGVWINMKDQQVFKYHLMGYDPGVSFHSAVYPQLDVTLAIPSNQSDGPFFIMKAIEEELVK